MALHSENATWSTGRGESALDLISEATSKESSEENDSIYNFDGESSSEEPDSESNFFEESFSSGSSNGDQDTKEELQSFKKFTGSVSGGLKSSKVSAAEFVECDSTGKEKTTKNIAPHIYNIGSKSGVAKLKTNFYYTCLSFLTPTRIVGACSDRNLYIFECNRNTLAEVRVLKGHKDTITCISTCCTDERASKKNSDFLASVSRDGNIFIWKLDSFKCIQKIECSSSVVQSISIVVDDYAKKSMRVYAPFGQDGVKYWNAKTGKYLGIVSAHESQVYCVCIMNDCKEASVDDPWLISGCYNGDIYVWKVNINKRVRVMKGHTSQISSLAMMSNETVPSLTPVLYDNDKKNKSYKTDASIFSGDRFGCINIWDLDSGHILFSLTGHYDQINTLCHINIREEGNNSTCIISSSNDSSIKVWSLESGMMVNTLKWHKISARAVCANFSENLIGSIGWDKTIQVHHVSSLMEVEKQCCSIF